MIQIDNVIHIKFYDLMIHQIMMVDCRKAVRDEMALLEASGTQYWFCQADS